MWFSEDGRLNIVARPSGETDPILKMLHARLASLSATELADLDQELEQVQWEIADAADEMLVDLYVEAPFEAKPVPDAILDSLNWEDLLGSSKHLAFRCIELRWRLDVLGVVQQAIADLSAGRGL